MASSIADLARRLAHDAEAVCRHYLSNGRRCGRYWVVGDRKRGKTGGGMNLRFTGGHELDLFWECCRPPTSMAYRTPI